MHANLCNSPSLLIYLYNVVVKRLHSHTETTCIDNQATCTYTIGSHIINICILACMISFAVRKSHMFIVEFMSEELSLVTLCFVSCDFCEWIMDRKTIIAMHALANYIRMLITKRRSKIAKLFYGGQTHKIALLTGRHNMPKVWYINDKFAMSLYFYVIVNPS